MLANISTEKNSPDQKTAIKIAQETMSNINDSLKNNGVIKGLSNAYLFPQPLKFADARLLKGKVSENYVLKNPKTIKTAYWEIVFRLEFSSTDTKPIKYPVYGGTVTVSVGIKGLIIGIYSDILPITGSREVDKFNPLSESGNTLAANPSIVYLFDFKENIIAPYFLKMPNKKKNTPDAQNIDNYVEDKNFLPPQQQDVYGLGYDALVPACAQSRLLEYGKFECPCNRLLNAGDVYIWVQTIREEPINFSQRYVASIYANKKHKMDKFGLFDLNNKAKALYSTLPETERDIYLFTKYLNETFNCYGINSCNQRMHFFAQTGVESYGFRITTEFADGSGYEGRADLGNAETGDGPRYKGRGLIHLTGRANYERYFHYIADNFQTNKYGERYVNATKKITLEARLLQLLKEANPEVEPTLLDLTPETVYSLLENRANNFHLIVSNSLFFACDAAGWYWTTQKSPFREIEPAYITETKNPDDYEKITLLTNKDVLNVRGYNLNRIADLGDNYVELISQIVNGGGNGWDKRIGAYKHLKEILKNIYLCKFVFFILISFILSCKNTNTNLLDESKNTVTKVTSFTCEPCENVYVNMNNVIVDSVVLSKGIKTVKINEYISNTVYECHDDTIGYLNNLYLYKVILLKNGKIISNREYDESFNSPYGDVEVNFVKKNNNLFTANDTHTSGKSRWVREYEIDWSNMTIIIRNETWEDTHPQKGLLKGTHEVNKTIDEYEAELKAEFSK